MQNENQQSAVVISNTSSTRSNDRCLPGQRSQPEAEPMNEPQRISEPPLFELEEDDGLFLLLPKEELQRVKQYTAASLRKWERLREAIAMLLPWWPLDEIAKKLHVSEKTLREFASRESEKVALSGKELAAVCRSAAARALTIAKAKEHGATYPQLILGAKLMIDAAGQLEQTGLVGEEKVVMEDRARLEGMERLRQLKELVDAEVMAAQLPQPKADAASSCNTLISSNLDIQSAGLVRDQGAGDNGSVSYEKKEISI